MVGALAKSKEKPCSTIDTLIGVTADLKGNIVFSGGLRIDGKVKGNITAEDDTNSVLILGEQAEIRGNVTVPHVVSNGKIRGHVHCSARVELESQAEIHGDVHYRMLGIESGAAIHGNLVQQFDEDVVTRLKPVARRGKAVS
ncbi:MAG: polymer-forming cytoskeletal protein [Gammaproteobacteria bacterium]|nr:polymer-forming cytoskeletal protein [Gammaproteobacteria bacterium]